MGGKKNFLEKKIIFCNQKEKGTFSSTKSRIKLNTSFFLRKKNPFQISFIYVYPKDFIWYLYL